MQLKKAEFAFLTLFVVSTMSIWTPWVGQHLSGEREHGSRFVSLLFINVEVLVMLIPSIFDGEG